MLFEWQDILQFISQSLKSSHAYFLHDANPITHHVVCALREVRRMISASCEGRNFCSCDSDKEKTNNYLNLICRSTRFLSSAADQFLFPLKLCKYNE